MIINKDFFKIEKKFWEIIKTICIFVVFISSSYIQLFFFRLFHLTKADLTPTMEIILSTLASIVLAIIFFLAYRKELKKEFIIYKKKLLENFDISVKWWLIGMFIMISSTIIINFVFHGTGANNEKAVQSMISTAPWLMIINAGILAPFNEEIVFRKSLRSIISNKWAFAFMSFLLFGGAHVIFSSTSFVDYLYIIPYGALGFTFALAYSETKTIFSTITIHMLHNTILMLFAILI